MQNSIYLHEHSVIAALIKRFGDPDTTFVGTRTRLGSRLIELGDA